jgi:hypothetical protein
MKAIRNTTQEPLRVSLGGGSVLHLGPGQTGQIADEAVELRGVKRLITSGAIALAGKDGKPGEFAEDRGAPHESSHGHTHGNKVFPSGNRGG